MAEEKFLTKHPEGKSGFRISKERYDIVRASILTCLQMKSDLTFTQLADAVTLKMGKNFEGSVRWFAEVVKLDLEARGEIERFSHGTKTLYRIKSSGAKKEKRRNVI